MAVSSAPLWLRNATLPGRAMSCAKVALNPAVRIHDAEAIGAEQPRRSAPQLLLNFEFERRAFRPSFLEARGDHDCCANPCIHALANNTGHGLRGCHDHGEVNFFRNVTDLGVSAKPEYIRVVRIDGINASVKSGNPQPLQHDAAHALFPIRRADHGDGFRSEHAVERGTGLARVRIRFIHCCQAFSTAEIVSKNPLREKSYERCGLHARSEIGHSAERQSGAYCIQNGGQINDLLRDGALNGRKISKRGGNHSNHAEAHSTHRAQQRNRSHAPSNVQELIHFLEGRIQDDGVGGLRRDIAAHPERDSYRRCLHGRRVVDPIADKQGSRRRGFLPDDRHFFFRTLRRMDFANPHQIGKIADFGITVA